MEGEALRRYIENQRISKTKIASDLSMSRRNLYQLFESKELERSTKKKFEDYFGERIFSGAAPVDDQTRSSEPAPKYEKPPELQRALENLTERGKMDSVSIMNLTESQKMRDDQITRLLNIMEVSLGISTKAPVEKGPLIQPGGDYGPPVTQKSVDSKKKK